MDLYIGVGEDRDEFGSGLLLGWELPEGRRPQRRELPVGPDLIPGIHELNFEPCHMEKESVMSEPLHVRAAVLALHNVSFKTLYCHLLNAPWKRAAHVTSWRDDDDQRISGTPPDE